MYVILIFRKNVLKEKSDEKSISTTRRSSIQQKTIKDSVSRGLLTSEQNKYLQLNFQGDKLTCKACQRRQNVMHNKQYCYHLNFLKPLSLNAWGPWQTSTQATATSISTKSFCSNMESCEHFRSTAALKDYENKLASKFQKSDLQGKQTDVKISYN